MELVIEDGSSFDYFQCASVMKRMHEDEIRVIAVTHHDVVIVP